MQTVAAAFVVPMVVAMVYAVSQSPVVDTLYTIPAAALIHEAAINEGCTASDCCAH
jgi:hypothetical protein